LVVKALRGFQQFGNVAQLNCTNTCGMLNAPLTSFILTYCILYVRRSVFLPSNLGNERKGKTGVTAEPELEGHVKGGCLGFLKSGTS